MKITVEKARSLFANLRALNGAHRVVPHEGKEVLVHSPYQFSGGTCLQIATHMNLFRRVLQNAQEAEERIDEGLKANPDSPEKLAARTQAFADVAASEIEVEGVVPIKSTGLNLDANAIPPGVLADLLDAGLIVN